MRILFILVGMFAISVACAQAQSQMDVGKPIMGGVLTDTLTGPVKLTAGVPSVAVASDITGLFSGSCPTGATCFTATDGSKQIVSAFPYAYKHGSIIGVGFNLDSSASRNVYPFGNTFNLAVACASGSASYWQMPIGGFLRNLTGTTGITNLTTPIHWSVTPGCINATMAGIGPVTLPGVAAGGVIDNNASSWWRLPQWNSFGIGFIRYGANNTAAPVSTTMEFISDDGLVDTIFGQAYAATLTASSTQYFGFAGGNVTSTETSISMPMAIAGTFKNLFSTNTATPTNNVTINLMKNGVASALTVTVTAADATGSYYDTTHTVSAAAGDYFDIQTVSGASTQAIIQAQGVVFVPTDGLSTMVWGNWAGTTVTTTNKYSLAFSPFATATLAAAEATMPFACTVSNLYVYQGAANGGSTVTTFTLMKNGSATAITGTANVGVSGSIALDTTHSVSYAQGDLITLQAITNTGTSGAMGGWSAKCT